MSRDRTVLGWARAGASAPQAISSCNAKDLDVLVVDTERAADARTCLKWQVRCFEAGVDFLPVAPFSKPSERDAIEVAQAQRERILDELNRLKGQGQLTLGMTWSNACATTLGNDITGRDWLRSRTQLFGARQAVAQRAIATLDRFNRAEYAFKTRPMSQRIERDLLVPAKNAKAVIQDIANVARCMEASEFDLWLTGPWPPFSFVKPFPGN